MLPSRNFYKLCSDMPSNVCGRVLFASSIKLRERLGVLTCMLHHPVYMAFCGDRVSVGSGLSWGQRKEHRVTSQLIVMFSSW